jgi:Protein of unknown function, DUF481
VLSAIRSLAVFTFWHTFDDVVASLPGITLSAASPGLSRNLRKCNIYLLLYKENTPMALIARLPEGRFRPLFRKRQTLTAALSLVLLTVLSGVAQTAAKKFEKPATKKEPEIKEELTLKNGDRLTGELLNSTGTEIKFKSDLAGEVTVKWENVKELKSRRDFAVVPKEVKDARNSAMVPQGAIEIGEKGILVSPLSPAKPEAGTAQAGPEAKPGAPNTEVAALKEISTSKIAVIVDDTTYQKEIHKRIGWTSGWDGHITTGTSMIYSTQNSYLFQVDTALKRAVPTVNWLDPKLRTTINFTLSAGRTTEPGTPETITNISHVDAERDEYFSPRGYYLQGLSFDHNYAQGLVLQQNYGFGVGSTLLKRKDSEFDVTSDLHYESQHFNATANVSQLNLNLVGSALTESFTAKWGKIRFDEKLLADIAWNKASAFSASGNSSVRMPVYKKLSFSVSTIDTFLNNPQVGYKKNSFQLTTGFALNLH